MIRFPTSLKVIPGAKEANKVKHREEVKESSGKAETAPLDTTMKVHVDSQDSTLLKHHSSKASILQCSDFFIVQLSHPYMTTGKTTALTRPLLTK